MNIANVRQSAKDMVSNGSATRIWVSFYLKTA
jgi:hypothetical protein